MLMSTYESRVADELSVSEDEAWIPGGVFSMGSDRHYPEEAPAHQVAVDGFWMDRLPVTNRQFRTFVDATGYITWAEKSPLSEDYPDAPAEMLQPGSLVFVKPPKPVGLGDVLGWWRYMPGADWQHPDGRDSNLDGLDEYPVVHIAYEDAHAYAQWAGKAMPTEAEWERAARGGREGADYPWGDELTPDGRIMANTWQGRFPWENLLEDGYEGRSPVGAFPPNDYDLYDMIGNIWEWTADWYRPRHPSEAVKACCVPRNPLGGKVSESCHPAEPGMPRKVLKGGSYLCAPNYCRRYRSAARYPQPIDTSTCHVGFRCVRRVNGAS